MTDSCYEAMKHAVDLARTGRFSNWWTIAARLRIKRYQDSDLKWNLGQREWLDHLCDEARGVRQTETVRQINDALKHGGGARWYDHGPSTIGIASGSFALRSRQFRATRAGPGKRLLNTSGTAYSVSEGSRLRPIRLVEERRIG